jgi:hypothetical protein
MKAPLFPAIVSLAILLWASLITSQAAEITPHLTVGTQEIGLSAGYLLPHRLTTDHTTKQSGPAFMPSWAMVLTDPIGDSWYRGQILLGAEIVYIQFERPELTQDQIPIRRNTPHQAVHRIRRRAVLHGSRRPHSRRVLTIQFHPDSRRRHLLVHYFTAVLQCRISLSPYFQCRHQLSQHRPQLESSLRRILILLLGACHDH